MFGEHVSPIQTTISVANRSETGSYWHYV